MGGFLDFLLDCSSQIAYLAGRTRGLIGKRFDFVCDNGKAAPQFARPFGFDGRIKRQKLGAMRDIVDQINDRSDFRACLFKRYDIALAFICLGPCPVGHVCGLGCLTVDFGNRG